MGYSLLKQINCPMCTFSVYYHSDTDIVVCNHCKSVVDVYIWKSIYEARNSLKNKEVKEVENELLHKEVKKYLSQITNIPSDLGDKIKTVVKEFEECEGDDTQSYWEYSCFNAKGDLILAFTVNSNEYVELTELKTK